MKSALSKCLSLHAAVAKPAIKGYKRVPVNAQHENRFRLTPGRQIHLNVYGGMIVVVETERYYRILRHRSFQRGSIKIAKSDIADNK